jgi:hypothetical protein
MIICLRKEKNTYIDDTSVTQTAPVQPSEQLNHGIARVSSQPPERVPRSLQSRLFNTSRLERRRMLKRRTKSATVALGIRSTTTLLRCMCHLQCRRRYSAREEQRGVKVRKVGDEGCRQGRV